MWNVAPMVVIDAVLIILGAVIGMPFVSGRPLGDAAPAGSSGFSTPPGGYKKKVAPLIFLAGAAAS